jgi:HPt (histidine-containing phosphotransfer) domain-containing protein
MDAFITKPFTLKQIVSCLEGLLAGQPLAVPSEPQSVAPGGETVLDEQVLDELRNIGGNTQLFERVLDLFAGRVPQAVDHVAALGRSDDLNALADAAHALKSMCANIGASRAVEACHELEHAARSHEVSGTAPLIAAVLREVQKVMAEVDRLRSAA